MLELAVTATGYHKIPPVLFQQGNYISYFHAANVRSLVSFDFPYAGQDSASLPPSRSGATRVARPVASSVSQ